jgi:HEAT repeat protein
LIFKKGRRKLVNTIKNKIDVFDEKVIEEEVKSTKELIQTFLQTAKAYRLYESNHPMLSKFLERLTVNFNHYFDEFDSFSLQIGEHQIFYRGKVVYESKDAKESLAFAFFKDGIREIRFFKGLESREIMDFLTIVRRCDLVNRLEDDLVTLFWEKDFSHMSITTADEFLEGNAIFVPVSEGDLLKGLEYGGSEKEGSGGGFQGKAGEEDIEGSPGLVAEDLKQALNLSPGQPLVQACQLNPDEMTKIDREIQQERQPDYLYVLINNLIEILLHLGEDMDAYENMISYFERTIESLLAQKEVGKAVAILKHLIDTMESMALKDKQIHAIRRIIETSSGSHFIELVGEAMKDNGEMDPEPIFQYFRLLPKQAIDPLCLLLGDLESGKWREVVCDFLTELFREEIQPLTKFLSDCNPILVCNILHILRKIGHPSTMKYLVSLVGHKDPKVREETLLTLTIFGEKGKNLIQRFLKDPEAEIRAKASLLLARMAKDQAVKPLVEIILSEDFYKRDYEEKATFFRALGETGSKEVIPVLKKIAQKRIWFNRAKWDEMRLCASTTLKMMGVLASPVK